MRMREEGAPGRGAGTATPAGRPGAAAARQGPKVCRHQQDQAPQQRFGIGEEPGQPVQLPAGQERQAGQAAEPEGAAHVGGQPVQPLQAEPGRMIEKVRRRMAHAAQDAAGAYQMDWGALVPHPAAGGRLRRAA